MPTVAYQDLENFIATMFGRIDVPQKDAQLLASALVQTEAKGVYSHGVALAGSYVQQIQAGHINVEPHITVVHETAATAMIDGDNGLGAVVSTFATELGIRKAKEAGSANISVRNANHYGAGLVYIQQAVQAGVIAYLYANADPTMAPFGGSRPYFGTNPYSFGSPMGDYPPYILDMATTVAAASKLLHHIERGTPAPEGWGLDRQGNPSTDAEEILRHGSLLPFGGPKGSGLAGMVDIVGGVLSGAAFHDVRCMPKGDDELANFGSFMQLTDIESFMPVETYAQRAQKLAADILANPPAPGFDGVYYPGYLEGQRIEKARAQGVPMADSSWHMLGNAAKAVGLAIDKELTAQ